MPKLFGLGLGERAMRGGGGGGPYNVFSNAPITDPIQFHQQKAGMRQLVEMWKKIGKRDPEVAKALKELEKKKKKGDTIGGRLVRDNLPPGFIT